MKTLIQAAVVTMFAASAAQAQQAVQWRVEDGGNGHWYAVVSSGLDAGAKSNWEVLDAKGRQHGGRLCTIGDAGENSFVSNLVTTSRPVNGFWAYIGATQISNTPCGPDGWEWNDGTSWTFTNWQPQQPDCLIGSCSACNETKVAMRSSSGQWGDWNGQDLNSAIIEWSADCNNDGIVDYGQCRDGSLPDYNGNNIPDCCESGTACVVGNYPVQWRVEDGGNGHWYGVTPQRGTWQQDRDLARSLGGDLATVVSESESMFLCSGVMDIGPWATEACWMGMRLTSTGAFEWVSGEPVAWTNWPFGPHNPPYPVVWITGPRNPGGSNPCFWNDADPNPSIGHIYFGLIEWSADCNDDGFVDYGQILTGQLADTNSNGVPDACEVVTCRDADFFPDRNVNGADLGLLLSQWGPATQYTVADLNRDGTVDGADLGIVLSFWGPCPY